MAHVNIVHRTPALITSRGLSFSKAIHLQDSLKLSLQKSYRVDLPQKIIIARKKKGLTQEQLADPANVIGTEISAISFRLLVSYGSDPRGGGILAPVKSKKKTRHCEPGSLHFLTLACFLLWIRFPLC
jgi:hypothetical protein